MSTDIIYMQFAKTANDDRVKQRFIYFAAEKFEDSSSGDNVSDGVLTKPAAHDIFCTRQVNMYINVSQISVH